MIGVAASALIFCAVTDDVGNTLRLTKPAQRIVSLAPDITENLFAAGAGSQIVGVVSGSDYPVAAKHIPSVGAYNGIDLEKILTLHPDLIVTWRGIFPQQIAMLRKLGIPIYTTAPRQLTDIPRTLKNMGCLAGTAQQAAFAAGNFSQQLASLRRQYVWRQPVTVFYQIGAYSLQTINQDSWINQVLTLCGGRNIFAGMHAMTPVVSLESVVMANPTVMMSDASNVNWQARWLRFPALRAVKGHHLYSVEADLLDRAGPRLLLGAATVCRYLEAGRS